MIPVAVRALLLLVVTVALLPAQNTTYQAPGAGKITIRYGAPRFREELVAQARPGLVWRLGANGPTTLESSAALLFEKGVIFPGSYNLGAGKLSDDRWNLIFHRDGNMFRGGTSFGQFAMTQGRLEQEALHAKALQLDLFKHPEKEERKAGGAMFRIRFGPHGITTPLRVVGVGRKRSRVGGVTATLESLKLTDRPEYLKAVAGEAEEPFVFARLTRTKDEEATTLALLPGEPPRLRLVEWNREIAGERVGDRSKSTKLKVTLGSKGLVLHLGSTELRFAVDDDALKPAETGGKTGG